MKALLNNKVSHIIITDEKTSLVGNNIVLDLNINYNKINNIVGYFFNSKELKLFIWDFFFNSWYVFQEESYVLFGKIAIFVDIVSFFTNAIIFIDSKEIQYFCFYIEKKLFFFHKSNLEKISNYILQYIHLQSYQNVFWIINSKNKKIFYQNKYVEKNIKKIQEIIFKNIEIFPERDQVYIFKNKNLQKFFLKKYTKHYNYFPEILLQLNLKESKNKEIKIDTSCFSPIVKLYDFTKNSDKIIWFWYWWVYQFARDKNIFLENIQNFSTWYSYNSKKLAKIKAFVEWIERYNSGIFSENFKKDNEINWELAEKIIWNNFENYNNKSTLSEKIFPIMYKENDVLVLKNYQYVPSEILFYPFSSKNQKYFSNSSWISAWRNYEEAIFWWLLELSERDSLMLTWLLKLNPSIIKKETLPEKLKNRILDLEKYQNWWNVTIFDISFDKSNPHVMIFFRYNDSEIIHIWASANIKAEETISKALDEVEVNVYFSEKTISEIKTFLDVNSVSDHRHFYCQNNNIQFLNFLFQSNSYLSFDEFSRKFQSKITIWSLLKELENISNWQFFVKNLTTEYSKNLWIYVVRVISEWLIPIWFWNRNIVPIKKGRLKNPYFKKFQKHKYIYNIPDFLHFFD